MFILGWTTAILFFGLLARFLGAVVSNKSRRLISENPIRHLVWFGAVMFCVYLLFVIPQIHHQYGMKAKVLEIRQNVRVKVIQSGDLDSLRLEVKKLSAITESGNWFDWDWKKRKNPELTNAFPLIAKLNPRRIRPPGNSANEDNAILQMYFSQWSGGRNCTRFYDLVLTPINQDQLPLSIVHDGDKVVKLTNSVYELTWQF